MRSLLYHSLPYLFTSLNFLGLYIGGPWVGLGLFVIFILHPILDHLLTKAFGDIKDSSEKTGNFSLYLWPIVQTAYLLMSVSMVIKESNPTYFLIGCISIGTITGGFGITIAHELIHRTTKWERGLGVWALALVNYAVFRIEHVHGHHRKVATPEDPASAKKGENIYLFIPKAIYGVFKGAISIENKRMKKVGKIWIYPLYHRIFHYLYLSIGFGLIFYLLSGQLGLLAFMIQSLIAISLLEMIDYVEHYGLQRKKLENGRYEPVGPEHSWDTNYFMTNTTLYNLGKHAHHHQVASLPFQHLTATDGANNYPFGYSTAVLIALVPPLWHKIVDPLIE